MAHAITTRPAGGSGRKRSSSAGDSTPAVPATEFVPPVRRVRKAYEQVADQLRELIMNGQLARGERLPTEAALAREFGVSRTTKGTSGGSYVTLPSVDHISDVVQAGISLLSTSHDVSLHEFLEIRELLEVPAARLAAKRHSARDVELIQASIPSRPLNLGTEDQFRHNREFHSLLIHSCGNTLLTIAAQPIFTVLQNNLARSTLGKRFHLAINEHHQTIASAVATGNARAAEEEMRAHLGFLRPFYEKAWRHAIEARERT